MQADVSPGVLRRHAANPAMAVTIAAGLAALPAAAVNMLLPNLCFGDQITQFVEEADELIVECVVYRIHCPMRSSAPIQH